VCTKAGLVRARLKRGLPRWQVSGSGLTKPRHWRGFAFIGTSISGHNAGQFDGASALDIESDSFSSKRKQKAKKPVPLEEYDELGRKLYARDNTQKKRIAAGEYLGEPLSPKTVTHLTQKGKHRLLGVTPCGVSTISLTEELRAANARRPFIPRKKTSSPAPGTSVATEKSTAPVESPLKRLKPGEV
jgi:hypothetical protein